MSNKYYDVGNIRNFEEYHSFLDRIYDMNGKSARTVTFQVTDDCNMACTYCYQTHKGHHSMPFEVAKKFIDLLFSDSTLKNDYLNEDTCDGIILEFIGGEPLLEVELMDNIIDYFRKKCFDENKTTWINNFRVSISSNGTLYRNPEVQEFLNKHMSHLSFSVSVDGDKELHDSCRVFKDGAPTYDIAIDAVKDWALKSGDMGSKITISPDNVSKLGKALKHLHSIGYTSLSANCVFENVWKLEDATTLYYQLKDFADYLLSMPDITRFAFRMFNKKDYKPMNNLDDRNWCGGDGRMIAVDYKGDIYPCLRYMESSIGDNQEQMCIGNVDTGIEVTEKQCNWVKCLQCLTRKSQSTEECWNCPIAEGCAWCTAYNYQEFGTPNKRATYICDMHRASSLANSYFFNSLYRKHNDKGRIKVNCPKDKALAIIDADEYNMLINLSKED